MPRVLPRLAAGALLAASVFTAAFADPQTAPLPESMQSILKGMHVEKYSRLTLLDEQGAAMDPDAFAQAVKSGHSFNMKKASAGDGPDITMRLVSKEEAAKTVNVPPKLKEGDAFPQFQLARLDGTLVDNSALAGKYALVSFYFSTCAPCIKEVPELNALAKRRNDINVVAVTFDSPEESKRFVEQYQFDWTVVPKARDLINAVGVKGYPTLMLLDPQGHIVAFTVGGKSQAGTIDTWVDKFAAPKG
ncbi:MAG: TlpA family protein disulfide reductase [Telluria sp.]